MGILIDPDKKTLTVYRSDREPTALVDGDVLTIPELFPGWELPIADLWPPVFE
ncbi:MAG: Uma2 family endonuclease [Cyanosarcina radialis HA8281-LM2]|nr:Uma2 family endonuclease [Cyanosarcina radialis HA8281-LM2]